MFASFCVLLLASVAVAVPRVSLPFNAQVPPVARVGQYYTFQLSPSTFIPEIGPYQYTLAGAPPWLNIDSASRTLWGTPGTADVGSKIFSITATSPSGSVVMEATLEVVDYLGPRLKISMPEQLWRTGKQSQPGNVVLKASQPFKFALSKDTFVLDGKKLSYYATMSDHTPLPAWLSFNAAEVKFFGVAPPLETSPQNFDVLLIASDMLGFAGGWAPFALVVTKRELIFEPSRVEVKISKGTLLDYKELRNHLKLDGQTIDDADLAKASASLPSWLTFNSKTLALEGIPPEGTESQDIEVVAHSRFGDVATTTVRLVYVSKLFKWEIGTLNATIGEHFRYTIDRSMFVQENVEIRVNLGSAPKWLTYDSASLTIHADVPEDVKPGSITGVITVSVVGSSASDSQTFQVQLRRTDSPESNPTPLVSTSISATPPTSDQVFYEASSTAGPAAGPPPKNSKFLVIIIATVVGLVLLIAAFVAIVVFCCCRKRRPRIRSPPTTPRKSDISRPIIQDDGCQSQHSGGLSQDVEKGSEELERTPEHPPQIQIDLPVPPPKSKLRNQVRQSQASSLGEGDAIILANFNRSSDWGYDTSSPTSHTPHDSMKLPTESLRLALRDSQSRSSQVQPARIAEGSPKKKRPHTTVYRNCTATAGLPVNRRVAGLGHGRNNTYSSPTRSIHRLSALRARDCNSCSSYSTQSTGLLSTTPSTFPVPPPGRPAPPRFSLASAEKRKSIRMIPEGTEAGPVSDYRPLHERRQSYIRNRAASRSPFFGARESNGRLSSLRPLSTLTSTATTPIIEKHNPLSPIATENSAPGEGRNRTSELYPMKDSLRRQHTHKSVATSKSIGTNWSASSSAEPPMRIRKTWDVHLRARLAGAAGISRPKLARNSSTHSSLRNSLVFESATESLYSQPSMTLNPQDPKTEDSDSAWEDERSGTASRSASFVLPPGPAGIGLGLSSLDSSAPGEGLRDFSGHLARDERGNILVYENATIEQLNVGIVVGETGRMSQQRRSRYASGQVALGHRRRPSEAMLSRGQRLGRAMRESQGRMPLGVVRGENELLSPRAKLVESKGKRPVSVENGRWGSQRGLVDGERGNEAFL